MAQGLTALVNIQWLTAASNSSCGGSNPPLDSMDFCGHTPTHTHTHIYRHMHITQKQMNIFKSLFK